jgi:hypothetical protein
VTRVLRVPVMDADIERYGTAEVHAFHRQDVILGDMTEPLPPRTWYSPVETQWVGPLELPALGYATWPYAQLPVPDGELHTEPDGISNARLKVRFDLERGGIRSFVMDGVEYARSSEWNFAQPVLERPASGDRFDMFAWPHWPEHDNWNPNWQAEREGPSTVIRSEAKLHAGCAEFVQEYEMPTGDRITSHYRVFPNEPSLELETLIEKCALSEPHALYLALPLEMEASAQCHFETAGAVVELDEEQLMGASRHYVTTGRFIRLQSVQRGLTVACPDTPLWQVGGFTFGRHDAGRVERKEAMLLAWLCNNYWNTNFQADQSGQFRQRFFLIPHGAEGLEASIRRALPHAVSPQLHWYAGRGQRRLERAQLLDLDLSGAVLTRLERTAQGVALHLLNPTDETRSVTINSALLRVTAARKADLANHPGEVVPVNDASLSLELPPRAWTGLLLATET